MSKLNNLKKQLTNITNDCDLTDLILNFFNKEFSSQDYLHLLRQERWKFGIYCPFCQSINIQKQPINEDENILRYLCLNCNSVFEDDTGSPLSGSGIPLHIWLQCWYLSQYCGSMQCIADRLNLDLGTIINMLHNMQNLFQAETLILKKTNNALDSTNSLVYSQKKHFEEESKKKLLILGDTSKQPTDTAEYRRQKNRTHNNKSNKKPKV